MLNLFLPIRTQKQSICHHIIFASFQGCNLPSACLYMKVVLVFAVNLQRSKFSASPCNKSYGIAWHDTI